MIQNPTSVKIKLTPKYNQDLLYDLILGQTVQNINEKICIEIYMRFLVIFSEFKASKGVNSLHHFTRQVIQEL